MNGFTSFAHFTELLTGQLHEPLPGHEVQLAMAPAHRMNLYTRLASGVGAVESAVLLLCFPLGPEPGFVLTRRTPSRSVHGGQISLPGGKMELQDTDAVATALRETEEEIGVAPTQLKVLGSLTPLYIPVSNFRVQPVVAAMAAKPAFRRSALEVAEVIDAPMKDLLDPERIGTAEFTGADKRLFTAPYFDIAGHVVWGATAMILSEFKAVLQSFVRP